MNKIILNIEGMHCMGCAMGVEAGLEELDFVKSAKVSLQDKNVEIEYDEKNFDIKKVKQVIEELGFKVI